MKRARGCATPPLHTQKSRPNARWPRSPETDMNDWPLWEVFIRSQHGLAHKHAGSLHAPDAEMAIKNARDVYTRRNEGVSIWVVKSSDVTASSPGEKGSLFEPANSKVYRHPSFYEVPEEVKNL